MTPESGCIHFMKSPSVDDSDPVLELGTSLFQVRDFVTQYDSNLLFLWSSLDTANRGLVVDYLGKRHKRVSGVFQVLV